MQVKINQFVVDVCRLICQLHQVGMRDRPEIRRAVVATGETAYLELLERQYSLALSLEDTHMIQTMLHTIKARLRFLG